METIAIIVEKSEQSTNSNTLIIGDLNMDLVSKTLIICGQAVRLTKTEYAILRLLMESPNQVIVKSVLINRIRADMIGCTERSLKQHISNLRKKMQGVSGVDYIETVCGIGFKLADQIF